MTLLAKNVLDVLVGACVSDLGGSFTVDTTDRGYPIQKVLAKEHRPAWSSQIQAVD